MTMNIFARSQTVNIKFATSQTFLGNLWISGPLDTLHTIRLDTWQGRKYYPATMSTRDQLLADIEAFLERHNMSAGDFGLECLNNVSFVYKLRRGDDVLASTIDRVREFMASRDRPLARRRKAESRPAA